MNWMGLLSYQIYLKVLHSNTWHGGLETKDTSGVSLKGQEIIRLKAKDLCIETGW
jgi:hypothetical protein